MVLVLTKCGKISDVQAAGSAVTAVLKKAVSSVRKSCNSYHEKAIPAVRKSCDSYHEKAVPAVKKSCLLWVVGAFAGKVISAFILWIWLKMVRSL